MSTNKKLLVLVHLSLAGYHKKACRLAVLLADQEEDEDDLEEEEEVEEANVTHTWQQGQHWDPTRLIDFPHKVKKRVVDFSPPVERFR